MIESQLKLGRLIGRRSYVEAETVFPIRRSRIAEIFDVVLDFEVQNDDFAYFRIDGQREEQLVAWQIDGVTLPTKIPLVRRVFKYTPTPELIDLDKKNERSLVTNYYINN